MFPRVHLDKYLQDLAPGLKIRHFLTFTVTKVDSVFFMCMLLNLALIYLDHKLSRESGSMLGRKLGDRTPGNGKPLFNSMFTLGKELLFIAFCVRRNHVLASTSDL